MRALLTSFFLSLLLALPVSAQTRETASTILVLDASGSMWGQIDGVNKIVIARQVISDLLPQLPADMALGLTMYGHNRRGDCSDIETVVPPGLNNRDQIAQIVNNVNPRGRTPLSAAVIQAAQQLRHTENPATVILVSDGRETCEMDPCAVGRTLEETGIDFTAHVIGFDVAEPADIAQLQCLADNTGGQFFSASNAAELSEALTQVTVAPAMSEVTLRAVVGPERAAPTSPLLWQIFGPMAPRWPRRWRRPRSSPRWRRAATGSRSTGWSPKPSMAARSRWLKGAAGIHLRIAAADPRCGPERARRGARSAPRCRWSGPARARRRITSCWPRRPQRQLRAGLPARRQPADGHPAG